MKLRTEMLRGPDGMTITAGYSEGKYSAREHDAACVHALMLAMDGIRSEWVPDGPPILSEIVTRADELLREWGFDSGEGI